MTSVDAVTAISELLYEHMARTEKTGYIHGCKCGWSARPDKSYRAHLASVLASHMAGAQAEAWKAGYREGCKHTLSAPFSEHPPNPFTADTGNTE